MDTVSEAITGNENQGALETPFQALIQFYNAFNSGDIAIMADNWWQSDEIVMDNPLGGIKRGWSEIKPVYERIFTGTAKVYVEYYDYTIHESSDIFYCRNFCES